MAVLLSAPILLSITLLISGLAKLGAREGTQDAMRSLRLPMPTMHASVASVLPVTEIVLALAIWIPAPPLQVLLTGLVAALMLTYLVIIARALTFEEQVHCSCFGTLASPTVSRTTLVRNVLLSVLGLLAVVAAASGAMTTLLVQAPMGLIGLGLALLIAIALTAATIGGSVAETDADAPTAPAPAAAKSPAMKASAPKNAKGKVIVAGVTISNPDKVLWPAQGDQPAVTKADLARYYEIAADRILPHVADRPVSIIRAPEGIEGERFFQRHAMPGHNPRLKLIDVKERKPYVGVADVGGLVAIGQSGGLELHPWGCKPGDPETPDQITFDLDPDEGLDFNDVIDAARMLKPYLEDLGLTPFVKTTGGKGLHVVVPIKADARSRVEWDQAKAFAKAVSETMRKDHPDRFTTTLAKKARGGKIFLDYLRNGRMATAAAPWSPRARPGATIAFPLSWPQVKKGLDPKAYTLANAPALLKKADPWKDFRKAEASLKPALKKMGL